MDTIYYFNSKSDVPFTLGGRNKEWKSDVVKHHLKYKDLLSKLSVDSFLQKEEIDSLKDGNYSFHIEIINKEPYNKEGFYLVELSIRYINRQVSFYASSDYIESLIESVV